MKNNSKYIKIFKNRIEKLYNLKNLKLLKIIIYESDSNDNTLKKLKME